MNKETLDKINDVLTKSRNLIAVVEYYSGEKLKFPVNEIISEPYEKDGKTLFKLTLKANNMNKDNTCRTCQHWKNQQAELDYSTFYGICARRSWKLFTGNESDAKVLDRLNRSDKYTGVQRFEVIGEAIGRQLSRYCLVTGNQFGCIHHQTVKP